MKFSDGKPRICGCCGVNPAVHAFMRGRGGRTKVFRCNACVEHKSVSWIALRRYSSGPARLASYEGAARMQR